MFGIEAIISNIDGKNFTEIPKFWNDSHSNGDIEDIMHDSMIEMDYEKGGMLPINAMMCYKDTGKDSFPYMIGSFVNDKSQYQGYETADIEAGLWAIFTTNTYTDSNMVEEIQSLWKEIFKEWLPNSRYQHDEKAELEVYYMNPDDTGYYEIWIPVNNK